MNKLIFDAKKPMTAADMSAILAHHDVVFRSPTHDPIYGLPIGNGDMGCLIYTEADRLHICVNKTDLWDDTKAPDEICCTMETDNLTVCRHGARMTLDFGAPLFELLYQNRYEGRLSLYDGTARISSDTPLAKTELCAFVSEAASVAVIDTDIAFSEKMPISTALQRYGSRSEWFWYWYYLPGTDNGLSGTNSFASDGILHITQELNGTAFCVALLPVCKEPPALSKMGSHGIRAGFCESEHHKMTFYLTVATADSVEDAAAEADRLVKAAANKGYDELYRAHSESWARFWSRSFVSLPFDYLENLWYLNLYYANSEMKGKYPAHFCNGLWNFYHDFVPWNHYFHYNMQLACFPLDAAGHPELLKTYYDFRYGQLPKAKAFAEKFKNTRGAFYADVCDRHGRNDHSVNANCTCGAQIAMMLYRHYLYNGERAYLEEKALPVMRECALFYLDYLTLGDDGYYHVLKTTGYEGSPMLDDSITDYAAIRALFGALCDVLPEEEAAPYKERLSKLAPYRMTEMYGDEYENGKFTRGIGKGMASRGERVLFVGRHHGTDNWIRKTCGNPEHDYYGFPDTEMAPLFPSGTLGIKDRGTELYDAVYNSVCLHHAALLKGNALGRDASDGVCMGWCMEPIYLARMGMSELLEISVENTVNTWMSLPQGFGYYTPADKQRLSDRWAMYKVKNKATNEVTHLPCWDFRHFDYETLPVLATAVNEMLLQSYDGTVRLFCAVKRDASYAFSLFAEGGFEVSAVYDKGSFSAKITSSRGGTLKLAAENTDGFCVYDDCKKTLASVNIGEICELETAPGTVIYAASGDVCVCREYERNMSIKEFGDARLGQYESIT